MDFYNAGPPISLEQISAFESEIGVILPEEYRAFLLRQNGGRPEPGYFRFGSKGESHVHELYALTESANSGLLSAYRALCGTPPRMPAEMLPIGCDDGGNQLCLATSGPNTGSVYFWDHEDEGEYGHPAHYENLCPITDSFVLFLDSLFSISADEIAARSEPYKILQHQDVACPEAQASVGLRHQLRTQ